MAENISAWQLPIPPRLNLVFFQGFTSGIPDNVAENWRSYAAFRHTALEPDFPCLSDRGNDIDSVHWAGVTHAQVRLEIRPVETVTLTSNQF